MANILENYHIELDGLLERFNAFLVKLEEKAQELHEETLTVAQEISNGDETSYYHFKLGIEGQFNALVRKGQEIFEKQINSKAYDKLPFETLKATSIEAKEYDKKIENAERKLDDFENSIQKLAHKSFKKVIPQNPEEKLVAILEDYDNIRNQFCCSQCGANLKLTKIYFVSAYITCEFCQTQNTFIPSAKTVGLPDLVREIAETRTKELEKEYSKEKVNQTYFEKFLAYDKWKRQHFFVKRDLINELAPSYKDIYTREINDFFKYYQNDREFPKEIYNQILEHFGLNFIEKEAIKLKSQEENNKQAINRNVEILIDNTQLNIALIKTEWFERNALHDQTLTELNNLLSKLEEIAKNSEQENAMNLVFENLKN